MRTAARLGQTGSLTITLARSIPKGTYTVRLTARDEAGRLVVATEELTVR
jgi:hypothetical protein